MHKRKFLAPLLLIGILPLCALAQPSIQGSLSGSLGPGSYIVVGNCQVDAGAVLTIQPGTTLLFSGHYYFRVYGQLIANGTETDSINFVRQQPTEACKHGGVRFYAGSSPNSSLSYCLVDYAKNTTSPEYYGGGVYVQTVGISISHCTISNGYASSGGGGIYATGTTGLQISDCLLYNNQTSSGGGLYLYGGSGAQVANCLFARNSSTST